MQPRSAMMNRDQTRRDDPPRRVSAFKVICALAGFSALASPAASQRPTASQIAAIRQACRADYRAHCMGVPTGGAAALACLRRNASNVSPACQRALSAPGGVGSSGTGAYHGRDEFLRFSHAHAVRPGRFVGFEYLAPPHGRLTRMALGTLLR